MTWNMASECISVVFLCIIWVYAHKGNPLPSLRNKLFQLCFLTTLCAMLSNIVSTFLLYHYASVPLAVTWVVTTLYFITTPLMGFVYFCYAASVLGKNEQQIQRHMLCAAIPALLYLLFIISNFFNRLVFDIDPQAGYIRGPCIVVTYLLFYGYCLMCMVLALFHSLDLSHTGKKILATFPLVAAIVVVVQQLYPQYILSGSAATCALLVIYLYLENKQISIDYLTGLPNRQVFLEMLELKLHKKRANNFLVIVLSLKGFKQINSKLGQHNGNLCLQQIARFLKDNTSHHLLYRFSGDEFVILCEDYTQNGIEHLVERLRARMTTPWVIGNYTTTIAVAIGILEHPSYMNGVETIINGIEYAVAQAKRSTASNCVYFTPEMLQKASRKEEIIEILKDRLKNETLELYYQPIFGVQENKFIIAESLSRLTNTPLGNISPVEFISIAEDTGLIIPMTYQILDQVCRFIRKLLDQGVRFSGISVNLSAVQFTDPDFSEKFLQIITKNNVPHWLLKIEITENIIVNNFEIAKNFMVEMHRLGILFGLDDFGTGYSNLSSVLQLPWDTIKLDRSLVCSAVDNERAGILVEHIADALLALDIKILAEGVENEMQKDFVIQNGCTMIQGFLYARPCPPEEMERIFTSQSAHVKQLA